MYPPPELRTSQLELLGSTTAIIFVVIVAVIGLAVFLGLVYWADAHPAAGIKRAQTTPGDGGAAGTESGPGQGQRPWQDLSDRHVPEQGHPHGKPRSWVLVAIVLLAFIAGGMAIILHGWIVVWVCAAIILVSIPVGRAIGIMDDTIAWGSTPAAVENQPADAAPERAHSQRGS